MTETKNSTLLDRNSKRVYLLKPKIMQHQNIIFHDNANKVKKASRLSFSGLVVMIILSCLLFLSSCVLWVRTPGVHDNGNRGSHHDNGKHRGERHLP